MERAISLTSSCECVTFRPTATFTAFQRASHGFGGDCSTPHKSDEFDTSHLPGMPNTELAAREAEQCC